MNKKTNIIPSKLSSFIFTMIQPQKWQFIVLLIGQLGWGIQESLFPYFLKLFVDGLTQYQTHLPDAWHVLKPSLIAFVVIWLIIDFGYRVYDFLGARTYPAFMQRIRKIVFHYTLEHSHAYFTKNFAGTVAAKISRLPEVTQELIESFFTIFLPIFVAVIFYSYFLYRANPYFCLLIVTWALFHITITFMTTARISRYSEKCSDSVTMLNGKIVDAFTNISTIRIFARRQFEKNYFRRFQKEAKDNYFAMMHYTAYVKLCLAVASLTYVFFIVFGGIYGVTHHLISLGDFVLILSSLSIVNLVWYMSMNLVKFFENIGVINQSLSLISKPHEIQDAPHAKPLIVREGEIVFDHVTFNYHEHKNLFSDKNLVIHGGERVGLVGYSGSGKTTFVNLILRYYEIIQGAILIDGQDIKTITQESLRENITVIPQDTMLFHRTLMENIRYGRIEATDEEVFAAAKAAFCEEFINELPQGYHTLVGERGIRLSGGQRQHIAIARAFLKRAPILILDEATSALDSVTEKCIQTSLKKLMKGRTVIVIAHRLSTLAQMQRILVFDKGKIIAEGNHKDLLVTSEHYRIMWETQRAGLLRDEPETKL